MATSNAAIPSQSSPAAHAEVPTEAVPPRSGGDAVPLSGSGVMFFAQTTRRENLRARRKTQQPRGAPRPLPLKPAEQPSSARA